MALLALGNIDLAANATVLGILFVFTMDNLSVIKLRFTQPQQTRPFRIPVNFKNIPLTAVLGVLSCIAFFAYLSIQQPLSLAVLLALIALGFLLKKLSQSVEIS